MGEIVVDYFTDVLCIWAHGARPRIEELARNFPTQVDIRFRYVSIFGAARARVEAANEDEDHYGAFHDHLCDVVSGWDYVKLHPSCWRQVRPSSSLNPHLYLKAAQLSGISLEELLRLDHLVRESFFDNGRDIAQRSVLDELFGGFGQDLSGIHRQIDSGEAAAGLSLDQQQREKYAIPGSPTLVLNEGRQILYGNVGYRVIEANVSELMRNPTSGEASWC